MRIAIFSDLYLPSLGGTETAIYNQKKALEAAGHTVLLFVPEHFKPLKNKENNLFPLPRVPVLRIVGQPVFLPFPWYKKKISEIIRQHNVQLIHVQTEFGVANIGIKVARRLKLPVVYTAHTLLWRQLHPKSFNQQLFGAIFVLLIWLYWRRGPQQVVRHKKETWGTWMLRRLTVTMAGLANHVVSPSEHFKSKLQDWGCQTPVTAVPNMLSGDLPDIKPLPPVPTFVWIGRVTREKRPLEFIEAVKQAAAITSMPFTVNMYGGGPLLDQCRKAAQGVSQLRVHGPVDPSRIHDLFNASSALVLTSYRFDNQPMVIAEAVTHGRGVLYCDDELKEGLVAGSGKLSGPSPRELAEGLYELIKQPQHFASMSQAAAKNRYLFMPKQYIKSIESVYLSVLG